MNKKDNKFFFDLHDFEKEAEEEKEKRTNKTPPAPTFSLEDMEEARNAAFERGKAEGLQLAKDSIEQQTELLVQTLDANLQELAQAETQRHQDYLNHTVAMTYKAVKTLLPAMLDEAKEDMIKAALTDFFTDSSIKNEISLYIHPSMTDAVAKHIKTLSVNLVTKEDENLPPAQARVEWGSGAFEFKPDQLMEQILQTIKGRMPDDQQILDGEQKNPHTDEETPNEEQDS